MLDQLPEFIDPLHLADKRGELHGQIPLRLFGRLTELLTVNDGAAAVNLIFGREGRLAKIEGRIQAKLKLKCQNCLNAIDWEIDSPVQLGIVNSIDQANRLPDDYEPLMVGEGKMLLSEIIEEELLLAIPDYPKHDFNCLVTPDNQTDTLVTDEQSDTENPFSILAKLKT
jgi:uncharacterized protein